MLIVYILLKLNLKQVIRANTEEELSNKWRMAKIFEIIKNRDYNRLFRTLNKDIQVFFKAALSLANDDQFLQGIFDMEVQTSNNIVLSKRLRKQSELKPSALIYFSLLLKFD